MFIVHTSISQFGNDRVKELGDVLLFLFVLFHCVFSFFQEFIYLFDAHSQRRYVCVSKLCLLRLILRNCPHSCCKLVKVVLQSLFLGLFHSVTLHSTVDLVDCDDVCVVSLKLTSDSQNAIDVYIEGHLNNWLTCWQSWDLIDPHLGQFFVIVCQWLVSLTNCKANCRNVVVDGCVGLCELGWKWRVPRNHHVHHQLFGVSVDNFESKGARDHVLGCNCFELTGDLGGKNSCSMSDSLVWVHLEIESLLTE